LHTINRVQTGAGYASSANNTTFMNGGSSTLPLSNQRAAYNSAVNEMAEFMNTTQPSLHSKTTKTPRKSKQNHIQDEWSLDFGNESHSSQSTQAPGNDWSHIFASSEQPRSNPSISKIQPQSRTQPNTFEEEDVFAGLTQTQSQSHTQPSEFDFNFGIDTTPQQFENGDGWDDFFKT